MLARALGAAPDERRATEVVRRHALVACRADDVHVIACGPEHGRAELRGEHGEPTALAAAATPASSCLTVRLGRPHARRRDDLPLLSCELCGSLDADTACAPLTAAGTVVGAVLATGRALVDEAPEVLDEIAAIAGPAIAGVRAFDLASAHAHTDPLTGLPNRRAATDATDRLIALARRCAQPLTVMRIDVDGISELNDRLGAPAGNGVIHALAAVLRTRMRTSDLVARFGFDELLVVLPDTTADVGVSLGDDLRRLAYELTPTGSAQDVTVSVGVAAFPVDGSTTSDVLSAAERALLVAQAEGGDRVATTEPPDPRSLFPPD